MNYLIAALSLILVVGLLFPLKLSILIEGDVVIVRLYRRVLVHQDISEAVKELGEFAVESYQKNVLTWEDRIYLRLFYALSIRKVEIQIHGGLNDLSTWSVIYGNLWAVTSFLAAYCYKRDIPYRQEIAYQGPAYFRFSGIATVRLGKLLTEYLRLRRVKHERTSYQPVAQRLAR